MVALPITEAARSAEVLLGPYTADEHSKRMTVVRDRRLNRAYDASVRLAERVDPDPGKRKRGPGVGVSGTGPLAVAPLRVVAPSEVGCSSRDAESPGRPSKRLAVSAQRSESSGSSSSSSEERANSPGLRDGELGDALGRTNAEVSAAVGAFNVTRLEESDVGSTPSSIYAGDDVVIDTPPGEDAGGVPPTPGLVDVAADSPPAVGPRTGTCDVAMLHGRFGVQV